VKKNALVGRNDTSTTTENELRTYIIIIKFAYITEVLSHIDSTAYTHLWRLNNKQSFSTSITTSSRGASTPRYFRNNLSRTGCSVSQSRQTTCKNEGSQSSIVSDSTKIVCRNYKGHERCTFSISWRHIACRSPEAYREECAINKLVQATFSLDALCTVPNQIVNFLHITNMYHCSPN